MKKTGMAAILLGTLFTTSAMADTVAGLYLGAQGWRTSTSGGFADNSSFSTGGEKENFNFDSRSNSSFYAAFEHPLPFVPNVKVAYTSMDSDGTTLLAGDFIFDENLYTSGSSVYTQTELSATDVILYYELFDNDLVSLDLGINGKYVDGSIVTIDSSRALRGEADFSGIVPMGYGRVEFGLPFTGLGAYAEGSFLSFDDNKFSDYQIALTYSFIESLAIDLSLQAGYRSVDVDIDDIDDTYADMTFDGAFIGLQAHF